MRNIKYLLKKFASSANNDKRKQLIDSIETYAYGTSKNLICKKGEIKCTDIIKSAENGYL